MKKLLALFSTIACVALRAAQLSAEQMPFLDPASLSNVTVHVLDLKFGLPCPPKYSNSVENPMLFSSRERLLLQEALAKYWNVSTNQGPKGTVLFSCYQTNVPLIWTNAPKSLRWKDGTTVRKTVAIFHHTNSPAREIVKFGETGAFGADFLSGSNDAYHVSITRTGGGGTMFSFVELLDGTPHGLGARFTDRHSQGEKWNISAARTNQLTLYECRHLTNGMMIGDWFMWDAANGNLGLHLSFPTPYDAEKHRRLPGTGNPVNSP